MEVGANVVVVEAAVVEEEAEDVVEVVAEVVLETVVDSTLAEGVVMMQIGTVQLMVTTAQSLLQGKETEVLLKVIINTMLLIARMIVTDTIVVVDADVVVAEGVTDDVKITLRVVRRIFMNEKAKIWKAIHRHY